MSFYPRYTQPPQHIYHQPQVVIQARYPVAPPYTFGASQQHPSSAFDEMIKNRYTAGDNKLRDALSRAPLGNEARQEFLRLVQHLRIHKNLFMHTYVHLVSCCNGGYLHQLVDYANHWKEWNSVKQLARHSMIKSVLVDLWNPEYKCRQHRSLFAQSFSISDDDKDLLCHLLYCCRKPELYELCNEPLVRWNRGPDFKESEQVIDLLWEFLVNTKEKDVERRLRAHIYRMARKSAYLPRALQIAHTSISHEQALGPSGSSLAMMATMNGRRGNVFIKRVMCNSTASMTKCLELFAGEAILWKTLQHKNIVPFLGVVAEGTSFMGLVSPFYRNGSVKHYLREHTRDWVTLTKRFAKDIAKGLEYIHCHEPPIIHGDLKGDNVLVDDEGHARLGDFGQSYASDTGKYLDSTRVGLANSPLHWMAPELLLGGEIAKTTVKSDIYSFGCVLYEMLSGHIPFEELPPKDMLQCIRAHQRPNRPESVRGSDPVWRVADGCWESNPEDRPSARRIIDLLR
ncbi:kinase-like domain-containing protein [Chiua virens]|nr:kinase-like domain-containing protein [Chiua virens]